MTLTCRDCGGGFKIKAGRGRLPVRCAACRLKERQRWDREKYRQQSQARVCRRCKTGKPGFYKSLCDPCRVQRDLPGPVHERRCKHCNAGFESKNPLQVYCSNGCYRKRPKLHDKSTTERGYGRAHQRRRAELLPAAIGADCPLCGERMWAFDKLDADHVIPVSRGGVDGPLRIVHSSCNRSRQALGDVDADAAHVGLAPSEG